MRLAPLRRAAAAVLVAATAAALFGCTDPPGRSGTTDVPVTLRSIYGNGAASVGADALRALLDDAASPVRLRDVTGEVLSGTSTDSEGDAIALLRAGRGDIAVVRSGRLALAGVDSLLPLQAPMVVTNDEQARRIASDPLAVEAMGGLRRIGLVGLALVPGGLRHPFGYGDALTEPAQFRGTVINTRPDANVDRIMAALGATTDHSIGGARTVAAHDGSLRGIETSLGQQAAADKPAVVTSNLPLYEKFDVLVVRAKVYQALSADQQRNLRRSAQAAATTAVDARQPEQQALRRWCAGIGTAAVVATPPAIEAFRAALGPVVAGIRQEAGGALFDRMRALRSGTTDPPGIACTGPRPDVDAFALTPRGDQTVLDGTWRTEATYDDLLAATGDQDAAVNNAGVWTYRIRNGVARIEQPTGAPCTARIVIDGRQVLFDLDSPPANECGGRSLGMFTVAGSSVRFTWTSDIDGEVALDQALLHSFVRVGR